MCINVSFFIRLLFAVLVFVHDDGGGGGGSDGGSGRHLIALLAAIDK